MCDFNNLDEAAKLHYQTLLMKYVDAFGGKNAFLNLLEAIRVAKPHPLVAKHSKFQCEEGTIKWNKVIFMDKLNLLLKARIEETKRGNFLPDKNAKEYKKILNLVRTLGPIIFEITPAGAKEGESLSIKPFDIIDETTTKLNPIFDALFFCAVDTVKKTLNYKAK